MNLAKKVFLLLIVGLALVPAIAAAADRMVVCEYVTNYG
jgi:hypothetical protein